MSQSYEQWHAFIEAHLGQPLNREERSDGAIYFTSGDPGEVVVRLTGVSVTVWEYAVAWEGAHTQVVTPKLIGSIRWRRMSERAGTKAVQALIDAAREARKAKFRVCQQCRERLPPEWMHDNDLCVSCAQHQSSTIH